ncbi:MAG: hypothetical protein JXA11_09660 [Phycisphaerae bacterium]|nr:hypothetical protein [Phycisphaerae bacterium]
MKRTTTSLGWLCLGMLLAGCVSVKSPQAVHFKIGEDDDHRRTEDTPRRQRVNDAEPAHREPSADASREDANTRPSRRPNRKSKWDIAADIGSTIVGEGVEGFIFYAFDVLTPPDREVKLQARVKSYARDADVEGITLSFHRLSDGKEVGRVVTDQEGYAAVRYRTEGVGDVRFYVKVAGGTDQERRAPRELPPALLLVSVRNPESSFVVVDLDRTLVESSFFRVVLWDGGKPMPDSRRVMRRIAETHDVIYLTHRPDDLTRTSRLWLEEKGYPDGVLVLSTARGMVGDSGKFKAARLRRIRKHFPNLRFGVGDKESDIEAYRDNGMKAIWIPRVKDKPKHLDKLAERLGGWDDSNVIVVEDWGRIERAIFGEYRCSTARFADKIRARAEQLRAEEQKRRRRDEDDEDDEDEEEEDD